MGNLNLKKCCIHNSKCKCHACKPCKGSTDICRRCFSGMVMAKSSEQGYFKPWKLECPLCRGNYFPRVFILNMYLLGLGNCPGSDVDRPQTLGKYIRSRLSSDENIKMITFIYPKNHINIWSSLPTDQVKRYIYNAMFDFQPIIPYVNSPHSDFYPLVEKVSVNLFNTKSYINQIMENNHPSYNELI